MKGKIELRYSAPNVAKVRTRLENVPADFTQSLRTIFTQAAAEVVEENNYAFRAKVIAKVAATYPDLKASPVNFNSINNHLNSFYQIIVATSAAELDERTGVAPKTEAAAAPEGDSESEDVPADEFDD
jgi:hypothetical protein